MVKRKASTSVSPTSPVAMGKALVLFATSCAALSSHHPAPMGSGRSGAVTGSHHGRRVVHRSGRARLHHARGSNYNSRGYHHGGNHNGREEFQSIVALRYRDGDEDQPAPMRAANRSAVDSAATTSATTAKGKANAGAGSVATPTNHNQVVSMSTTFFTFPAIKLPSSSSSRRTTAPTHHHPTPTTSSPTTSAEQLAMDEYIEYVERRYSRSHPKQVHHSRPQHHQQRQQQQNRAPVGPRVVFFDFEIPRKIFLSTLALHRPSTAATAAMSTLAAVASPPKNQDQDQVDQEEEEDPLNVLGLSSLASPQLRQRLHVPHDLRDEASLLASSTESAVNFLSHCMMHSRLPDASSIPTCFETVLPGRVMVNVNNYSRARAAASQAAAVANEGGRTSSYISLSPVAQLELLMTTLRKLTMAFVNTFKILTAFSGRMFREVLEKGGFRKSVRMMGMASVAAVLMFRPLFGNALKQG